MKLLPCPFCASKEVSVWDFDAFKVNCGDCEAEGPLASTEAAATKWWNEVPRVIERRKAKRRLTAARVKQLEWDDIRAANLKPANDEKIARENEFATWAAERRAWLARPVEDDDACH